MIGLLANHGHWKTTTFLGGLTNRGLPERRRKRLESGRPGARRGCLGGAVNALGNPLSPFSTDEKNSLTVFMTTGAERLESVTQEAMLNGANAALVLKANGEP
jgi:hypothetical protein